MDAASARIGGLDAASAATSAGIGGLGATPGAAACPRTVGLDVISHTVNAARVPGREAIGSTPVRCFNHLSSSRTARAAAQGQRTVRGRATLDFVDCAQARRGEDGWARSGGRAGGYLWSGCSGRVR